MKVSVDCPAKTNITLHVGAKHADWGGRHELDTIYCALGVYDTVTVSPTQPGGGVRLSMDGEHLADLADLAGNGDNSHNHAVRAVNALAQASGHNPDVDVHIVKRIPVAAGLAGGSADAAATLLALDTLWDLHWPIGHLQQVAATLGADMPFCLTGGYAHGTGFGERITPIPPDSESAMQLRNQGFAGLVLVGAYDSQLSTPRVYAEFDRIGDGRHNTGDIKPANDLQYAAVQLHPRSGTAIDLAIAAGATHAFVSGSGPSVVAFVPNPRALSAVAESWRAGNAVDRIIEAQAPAVPRIHVVRGVSDCR